MSVVLSFEKVSILNKFCFPWWYYPAFIVGKLCISSVIMIFGGYLSGKNIDEEKVEAISIKVNRDKTYKLFGKMTHLPNDIIDEILSYIDYSESYFKKVKLFDKPDWITMLFQWYLMLYIIVSGPINGYCWYMAINNWSNAFETKTDEWTGMALLMFDSIIILPNYVPVTIFIHYFAFIVTTMTKILDYKKHYHKRPCLLMCNKIGIAIAVVFGISQITPIMVAALPAAIIVGIAGLFVVFPITLCFCGCMTGIGFLCDYDIIINEKIVNVFALGVLMMTYCFITTIFVSTVCIYDGNPWWECIKYSISGQYCPTFNFDYTSFDAWIWIIKWAFF